MNLRLSTLRPVLFGSLALCVSLGSLSLGCGGSGRPAAEVAQVKAGEMPDGESWDGVYYHPIFGHLHLVKDETRIIGRWKRSDQSAWGELEGTVQGNLVRYQWTEHKIGLVGKSATTQGKGYFIYHAPQGESSAAELEGQFGMGDDEVGADWKCVKQIRMLPDLDSVNGDTSGVTDSPADGWK